MNNYCVYMHQNKINGLIYIGMTSSCPEKRFNNGRGYQHNSCFAADIEEYGWSNFDHFILFDNLTESEAKLKEVELIADLQATNPDIGYNRYDGGQTMKHTNESKQKIRESKMGHNVSTVTRDKLRKAFGQKVLCIELNRVFDSMKEAGEYFGLKKCTISAVIKGRNKTAAGYHWKLVEDA